jgi:hypothetical protein
MTWKASDIAICDRAALISGIGINEASSNARS